MKTKILLLLVSVFILQSCGNDKKPERGEDKNTEEVSNTDKNNSNQSNANSTKGLMLTINADYTQHDSPVVYWKEKGEEWFTEDKTIYGGTNGSPGNQNINFKFPDNAKPEDIRIDISNNSEQKNIKINFIRISNGEREFYVFGDDLENYFTPNEYISFNKDSKTAKLNMVNNNFDPFFKTKPDFLPQLSKIVYNY